MLAWLKKERTPNVIVASPEGVHPRGFTGKNLMADQANYFSQRKRSPKVILDVGANVGDTAERYAEYFTDAQVYAFEPCEETFEKLVARFRGNRRIHSMRTALSDRKGSSEFFTYRNSAVNSLLPIYEDSPVDSPDDVKDKHVCTVETTTIDGFLNDQHISEIDILKLDVQGGEVRTLNGGAQALAENRVRLIVSEVNFCSVYDGQAWFFDVAGLLHSFGYVLWDFYNFTYTENGKLKWGDAIFVPSGAL